jgi:hypothetical protein
VAAVARRSTPNGLPMSLFADVPAAFARPDRRHRPPQVDSNTRRSAWALTGILPWCPPTGRHCGTTLGRQPRSLGGLAGKPQTACRCRKATTSRSEGASVALPQSGQHILAGMPWLIRRCADIQLAAFSSCAGSRQSGQYTQSISAADAPRKARSTGHCGINQGGHHRRRRPRRTRQAIRDSLSARDPSRAARVLLFGLSSRRLMACIPSSSAASAASVSSSFRAV